VAALLARHDAGRTQLRSSLTMVIRRLWQQFLLTGGRSATGELSARDMQVLTGRLRAQPGVDAFYDETAVQALARQMAQQSRAGQLQTAALASQFQRQVLAVFEVQTPAVPTIGEVRRDVDPFEVYQRPARTVRYVRSDAHAAGRLDEVDDEYALAQGLLRLERLVEDDLMLASRDGAQAVLAATEVVTGWRRVVRPELSRGGVCGLCIVASDRIYSRENLMPLHARCRCDVLPVLGGLDPGGDLNASDLGDFYVAAGSTAAKALKATRVRYDEHGEMGPVLTRAEDARLTERQALARRRD